MDMEENAADGQNLPIQWTCGGANLTKPTPSRSQSHSDKASGLVESGVCFQTRYTNKYGIVKSSGLMSRNLPHTLVLPAWVRHMTNHSDRNETTTSTLTFTDGSPGQRLEHYW
ncbi:hypothetical protein P875_00086355 [Aspergillus parasiticus SU-1]|uniref:Uncharacterized protein n=1 Tax=Aspergillus parasiticus (strain ATCC 56775 / NRRL 5862 / SRRC 143 / SU-1) TaxID=1403190 RepID=A0A0F0I814_ASPPU|nr:hypothetical protein P875_00086355 [Aspergillus parasiticus SU-1]